MSTEKEKKSLTSIQSKSATVEIKNHPPEIAELSEETIAIARAKLAGIDFDEIYGDHDRSSPELMVRLQTKKIRELFGTAEELRISFSSEQNRVQAMRDMLIDGIDIEFIRRCCSRNYFASEDDADLLIYFGFGESP